MKENNLGLGKMFANKFDKKYGVITYSGTLAIELSLLHSGLKKGDKVIVANNVCYSIINTLFKLNFVPVVICPQNNLFLTSVEVEDAIKQYDAKGILLIYQYGIVMELGNIKEKYPYIVIIEDIAQAWGIEIANYSIGKYSDYIVTSFGKTKPLSYGIGGAILTNNNILDFMDFCDVDSRDTVNILYSYALPICDKIDYNYLCEKADRNVRRQRLVAKLFSDFFINYSFITFHHDKDQNQSVWHRFPIWIEDSKKFQKVICFLDKIGLEYQLPHDKELNELKKVENEAIIVESKYKKKGLILLRTRISNISDLKRRLYKLNKCMNSLKYML